MMRWKNSRNKLVAPPISSVNSQFTCHFRVNNLLGINKPTFLGLWV